MLEYHRLSKIIVVRFKTLEAWRFSDTYCVIICILEDHCVGLRSQRPRRQPAPTKATKNNLLKKSP